MSTMIPTNPSSIAIPAETALVFETEPIAVACLFTKVEPAQQHGSVHWALAAVEPMEQHGELSLHAGGAVKMSGERILSGPHALILSRDEAQGYYLNLESPEPSFFCRLRYLSIAPFGLVPQVTDVSLSYEQGARWMDGGERVERIAAPVEILPWIAEFAQAHFQVEGKKRKRGEKPSFMPRPDFDAMTKRESAINTSVETKS